MCRCSEAGLGHTSSCNEFRFIDLTGEKLNVPSSFTTLIRYWFTPSKGLRSVKLYWLDDTGGTATSVSQPDPSLLLSSSKRLMAVSPVVFQFTPTVPFEFF